jgi:cellulose biosynthesis protein BcsQ
VTVNYPVTLTIASGKGGVGKTCLSANLAYIFSKCGRTLLVDLDLQNQGCTSLIMKSEEIKADSVFSTLKNETCSEPVTHRLRDNLDFLPAISFDSPPTQTQILDVLHSPSLAKGLDGFVASISSQYDYIIFDCHGGVDELSRAAFFHSTDTLIVTEPDGVTFAGTLELLRFYGARFTNAGKLGDFRRNGDNDEFVAPRRPNMRMIVNRLRGNLSFRSLSKLYAPYFELDSQDMGPLLIYIPTEDLLSESFGEVPFFVELLPKSIFAKKLYYLMFLILRSEAPAGSYISFLSKMSKKRARRKVQRTVAGLGDRLRRLLTTSTIVSGMSMVLVFGVLIIEMFRLNQFQGDSKPSIMSSIPYLLSGSLAMSASFSYFTLALRGVGRLYGQRYKFDRAAKRLGLIRMEGYDRLRSALLITLRTGLWFAMAWTAMFAVGGYWFIAATLFFPEIFSK